MHKISIVCVGKLKDRFFVDAAEEYCKRLSRFADVTVRELPEKRTLEEEGEAILRELRGYKIALAVEGKMCSSEALAADLRALTDAGKEITFVIGSSCGLCPAVKRACDRLLSFSPMTFPHRLMRVMLLEQVYRAFMINAGAEYHK